MTFTDLINNGVPVKNNKVKNKTKTNIDSLVNDFYSNIVHKCNPKDFNDLKFMPYLKIFTNKLLERCKKRKFLLERDINARCVQVKLN